MWRTHVAVIAALLLALSHSLAVSAQEPPQVSYPPLGRLIDIGGRTLHLHCSGEGSPTVILVAGGVAFSIDWALVQEALARTTRVCSYDRAGLGWSDPGPLDETVEQTVTDLNRLLLTAGEPGPYLLVGASVAGIFVRAYQHTFPEDVAGLVFANTTNRIGLLVPGGGGLLWDLSEDQVRSIYPLPSEDKGPRPSRLGPPFDRLPLELQPIRLWLEQRLWEGADPTSEGPATYLSWRREFLREFDEKCSGREYPLVDLPLVVLSSNPAPSPTLPSTDQPFCLPDNAADGLNLLSSNSLYVEATGSGHEIHLFQPEVVVRSLDRALAAIRSGLPLSSALQGLDSRASVTVRG